VNALQKETKILPYTDVNLFDILKLYLLELVLRQCDVTVTNPCLNDFKQSACLSVLWEPPTLRQTIQFLQSNKQLNSHTQTM
jgi:hypothetical protein